MPVGKGRFRVVQTAKGPVRLHFTPKGTVNEAKNLDTGATHTPKEFQTDRRHSSRADEPKSSGSSRRSR